MRHPPPRAKGMEGKRGQHLRSTDSSMKPTSIVYGATEGQTRKMSNFIARWIGAQAITSIRREAVYALDDNCFTRTKNVSWPKSEQ
jgi:hypothetical protein